MEQKKTTTLHDKLLNVQQKLKAPKNQVNQFGKYKYRSCEDILEAVKPLAIKYGAVVNLSDEVIQVGERIYVKARVSLFDMDDIGESISSYAFAREEETKKGMDGSQITGAASSYARKYALNGMFAIDDTKDADSLNTSPQYTQPDKNPYANLMKEAMGLIDKAQSNEELLAIHNKYPELHDNANFMKALSARKTIIKS